MFVEAALGAAVLAYSRVMAKCDVQSGAQSCFAGALALHVFVFCAAGAHACIWCLKHQM